MTKVKIVYASLTGNNEAIADYVASGLTARGLDVDVEEMSQALADDLADVDVAVVASYTYSGVTDGELPDEAIDFYEDLQELTLPALRFAVCGSGDSTYEQFCTAVDQFQAAFLQAGATPCAEPVKVDLAPEAADWAHLDAVVAAIAAL
ncbi:flavodoxin [Lacticaseibacillus absianus]|uniref:flavodoxin n=1 Tax=Lacticaseibacillus absianus TaxID=2729623 RepID=UPI0015C911A9|nr:flavodoxin [Lacticaseibacillus absianus]